MDEIIYVSSNLHNLIFRCWMNYCKLFTGPNQRGLRNFLRLLPDSFWTFRTSAGRRLHGRCQGPRLHVRCRYDHYCTKFLLADRGVASHQILGSPIWLEGKWPFVREIIFSVTPSSNSLVSVLEPWRVFELTLRLASALNSPRALLPELQRNMATVNWTKDSLVFFWFSENGP